MPMAPNHDVLMAHDVGKFDTAQKWKVVWFRKLRLCPQCFVEQARDRIPHVFKNWIQNKNCLSIWAPFPQHCRWTIPLLSQRKISAMRVADGMLCQSGLFTTSYTLWLYIASLLSSRWQSRPAGIHPDKRLQAARNGAKAREASHLQQMRQGKNQTMRYFWKPLQLVK